MVILRYFRLLCVTGVVISGVSFILGTLAIATGSWLVTQGDVSVYVPIDEPGLVTVITPWNQPDNNGNATNNSITTITELALTSSTVSETQTTDLPSQVTVPGLVTVKVTSGLWHICQTQVEDGVAPDWMCFNIILNLSSMQSTKQLIMAGQSFALFTSLSSSRDLYLSAYLESSGVYFQSMLAFELISVTATLAGCCIAIIAIIKQQPLAVLVAAFTMFFAGMFMMVGHFMMLSIHKTDDSTVGTRTITWYYGWSFIAAWLSFSLCLVSGIINCIVYRNFRKMSEELTATPSRVKYTNRQAPVTLGSTI